MCWGVLRHCPISGKFLITMTLLFFHLRISQKLWKCFLLVQVHIWKPFIVLRLMLKQFSENLQKAPPNICLVWSWVTSEAARFDWIPEKRRLYYRSSLMYKLLCPWVTWCCRSNIIQSVSGRWRYCLKPLAGFRCEPQSRHLDFGAKPCHPL